MKVLIINPPRYKNASVTREGRCELILEHRVDTPATLLIIASMLRDMGNEIDFIDANGFNLSYRNISELLANNRYDLLIFTFNSWIIDYDLEICSIVKKLNPNCITIGYSWYAKKYAKEILEEYQNLDILIIQEPFSVIENVIKVITQSGNINDVEGIALRTESRGIIINPDLSSERGFEELPLPAYDLLPSFKPYYIYSKFLRPYALVYAGKGCPFSCTYCNVANTRYSGRSAKKILAELRLLKKLGNVKFIWFYDEIFTLNRKRVIEVCNGIIKEKLNIKWFCDSRVDLVDKNLLRLMKKAGCIGIAYGVESGSQKILNLMNKGITINQARNSLIMTRKAKIPIQLNLIIGYIGESDKTLEETKSFVKDILPETLQVTKMMALDDTEFSKIAIKNKWIKNNLDWKTKLKEHRLKLKNYVPFKLKLFEQYKKLYRTLYYNPKWWYISFKSLINNYVLILPTIAIILRAIKSRRTFSGLII